MTKFSLAFPAVPFLGCCSVQPMICFSVGRKIMLLVLHMFKSHVNCGH